MTMSSHTTNDDDSRGCIPSKTVPGRCKVMTHLLAVESRNPLAMAHTFDEALRTLRCFLGVGDF